jgi:hypothetical protein
MSSSSPMMNLLHLPNSTLPSTMCVTDQRVCMCYTEMIRLYIYIYMRQWCKRNGNVIPPDYSTYYHTSNERIHRHPCILQTGYSMVAHVDFIGYNNFGSHIRCKQLPHGTIHMERIVTIFDFYSNIMIPGDTSRMKRFLFQ